jgi:uncharacterized membrane protein HdeD (DUF308 family)
MENMLERQIKHWWLSVLLGVLLVIMGIWVIMTPIESYITLSIFFSAIIFVSGISGLIFTLGNKNRLSGWGWHLASAILDLLFGAILLMYPGLSMVILPFIVAFWFMFSGFSAIGLSGEYKRMGMGSSGWGIAFGILTIILAFIIIFKPIVGALTIVYMTGFAFMSLGIFRITMGIQLKKLGSGN